MNQPSSFQVAAQAVIPFGKYKGQTIDQVGSSDSGLLYLDWARGEGVFYNNKNVCIALATYLDDQAISKALMDAMGRR